MMVATSLVYIVASELADDLMGYSQAPECVQGLSGLNFALKVSVILSWYKCGKEKTYPYIIFEVRSFMCRFFFSTISARTNKYLSENLSWEIF